jgi:hypothetical protein
MAVTKDFALEIDTELSNLWHDEWRILDKISLLQRNSRIAISRLH